MILGKKIVSPLYFSVKNWQFPPVQWYLSVLWFDDGPGSGGVARWCARKRAGRPAGPRSRWTPPTASRCSRYSRPSTLILARSTRGPSSTRPRAATRNAWTRETLTIYPRSWDTSCSTRTALCTLARCCIQEVSYCYLIQTPNVLYLCYDCLLIDVNRKLKRKK